MNNLKEKVLNPRINCNIWRERYIERELKRVFVCVERVGVFGDSIQSLFLLKYFSFGFVVLCCGVCVYFWGWKVSSNVLIWFYLFWCSQLYQFFSFHCLVKSTPPIPFYTHMLFPLPKTLSIFLFTSTSKTL